MTLEVDRVIPAFAPSGEVEVTDEWLVRATQENVRSLLEFERFLVQTAQSRGLTVMLYKDLLRNTWTVKWEPAASPKWVGVWSLV